MLFTAIAATVVILPWAIDGPAAGIASSRPVRRSQLAQQPLVGLGGGVTVREISQTTPFSMVALTGWRPDRHVGPGPRPACRRLLGSLV